MVYLTKVEKEINKLIAKGEMDEKDLNRQDVDDMYKLLIICKELKHKLGHKAEDPKHNQY